MPTGRPAPARDSRTRYSPHRRRRSAGRPDSSDHRSGPEQVPPSRPPLSRGSPKPESAPQPVSGYTRRGVAPVPQMSVASRSPFRLPPLFCSQTNGRGRPESIHLRAFARGAGGPFNGQMEKQEMGGLSSRIPSTDLPRRANQFDRFGGVHVADSASNSAKTRVPKI